MENHHGIHIPILDPCFGRFRALERFRYTRDLRVIQKICTKEIEPSQAKLCMRQRVVA